MFLVFNNGVAATADHIELDQTNRYIKTQPLTNCEWRTNNRRNLRILLGKTRSIQRNRISNFALCRYAKQKTLTDRMKYAFYLNLEKLKKQGFTV